MLLKTLSLPLKPAYFLSHGDHFTRKFLLELLDMNWYVGSASVMN